jgi:hypothetical protein
MHGPQRAFVCSRQRGRAGASVPETLVVDDIDRTADRECFRDGSGMSAFDLVAGHAYLTYEGGNVVYAIFHDLSFTPDVKIVRHWGIGKHYATQEESLKFKGKILALTVDTAALIEQNLIYGIWGCAVVGHGSEYVHAPRVALTQIDHHNDASFTAHGLVLSGGISNYKVRPELVLNDKLVELPVSAVPLPVAAPVDVEKCKPRRSWHFPPNADLLTRTPIIPLRVKRDVDFEDK